MKIAQGLQISFSRGKPYAAYFSLERDVDDKVHHTRPYTDDLIVDYHEDGRPFGIEILNPGNVDPAELARLLYELSLPTHIIEEFEPVLAGSKPSTVKT